MLHKHKINLTYFKASGKYYTDGSYETDKEWMSDVFEEVKAMSQHPGLQGRWTEGFIHVTSPDHPNSFPGIIRV